MEINVFSAQINLTACYTQHSAEVRMKDLKFEVSQRLSKISMGADFNVSARLNGLKSNCFRAWSHKALETRHELALLKTGIERGKQLLKYAFRHFVDVDICVYFEGWKKAFVLRRKFRRVRQFALASYQRKIRLVSFIVWKAAVFDSHNGRYYIGREREMKFSVNHAVHKIISTNERYLILAAFKAWHMWYSKKQKLFSGMLKLQMPGIDTSGMLLRMKSDSITKNVKKISQDFGNLSRGVNSFFPLSRQSATNSPEKRLYDPSVPASQQIPAFGDPVFSTRNKSNGFSDSLYSPNKNSGVLSISNGPAAPHPYSCISQAPVIEMLSVIHDLQGRADHVRLNLLKAQANQGAVLRYLGFLAFKKNKLQAQSRSCGGQTESSGRIKAQLPMRNSSCQTRPQERDVEVVFSNSLPPGSNYAGLSNTNSLISSHREHVHLLELRSTLDHVSDDLREQLKTAQVISATAPQQGVVQATNILKWLEGVIDRLRSKSKFLKLYDSESRGYRDDASKSMLKDASNGRTSQYDKENISRILSDSKENRNAENTIGRANKSANILGDRSASNNPLLYQGKYDLRKSLGDITSSAENTNNGFVFKHRSIDYK